MTSDYQNKLSIAVAWGLFALLVLVHVLCGDFPKAIDVLPDERRYIEIARSLFSGNGLVIRGAESSFQKILYPISLFPALLFEDGRAQVQMIGVLNAIYASSTVFGVLAIARKLFDDVHMVIACLVASAFIPDLMYSMTFMSEPLFMPLSLWVIYLCWRSFCARGLRSVALSALAGLLCYATYLCKEVALMYVIAFLAWQGSALAFKLRPRKESACCAVVFAACFAVPFSIMKLTLFAGLGNSYSQFSFDILLSPYTVLFGLYSLAVDGTHFIVAFGVFPLIVTLFCYRGLTRCERNLFFFCLSSFVVGLLVVVFTISMREDVGHVALRQHVRYVAPLAPVALMLFAKVAGRVDLRSVSARPRRFGALVATTSVLCAFVALLFASANYRQGFDFSHFHVLRALLEQPGSLDPVYFDSSKQALSDISASDGALLDIDWIQALCRLLVIAYIVGGTWALMSRSRAVQRASALCICAVIVAFMGLNSAALYSYNRGAYEVSERDIAQICSISDELGLLEAPSASGPSDAPGSPGEPGSPGSPGSPDVHGASGGKDVAVVLDDENTGANNLIDTYLQDGAGAYRYLHIDDIEKYAQSRSAEASGEETQGDGIEASLSQAIPRASYRYILVNTAQEIDFASLDLHELMGGDEERFILYEVIG